MCRGKGNKLRQNAFDFLVLFQYISSSQSRCGIQAELSASRSYSLDNQRECEDAKTRTQTMRLPEWGSARGSAVRQSPRYSPIMGCDDSHPHYFPIRKQRGPTCFFRSTIGDLDCKVCIQHSKMQNSEPGITFHGFSSCTQKAT